MQKARNFNDVAVVSIKGSDYRIHFWNMGKDDTMNIMKNSNLNEKRKSLQIYKMSETTYYQKKDKKY